MALTAEERASAELPARAAPTAATTAPQGNQLPVGHSIARGALAMLSTQPLTWGATLLGTALFPRLLGADTLGQLTLAAAICNIASTAAGLGVSEYLVRRVAQHPATLRHDTGIALAVQLVTTFVGVLVVAVLGWQFVTSIVAYPLFLVALLPMLNGPAQTVLLSSFRGRELHRNYAWLNASGLVLSTLGALGVLAVGGDAVTALATAGLLAVTATLAGWKLSGLRPTFPAPNATALRECGQFVRAGLPFLSWQMTQIAYSQIDRLLMGSLVPISEIGWYAAANRIMAIPIFIPTLIITPLFPALSRSANEPDVLRRTISQTLRFVLLLTVPLSAGTIVVASVIPPLLGWPADFDNAVLPMQILALQLPLVAVGMVLGSVLMAIGREARLVIVALTATVFNIVFNLLAIPALENLMGNGGIGAALVTVASEILMLVGALALIPRRLLSLNSVWDAARVTMAGVATALVGLALLPVSLLVCVPAGAATYVAATWLLRVLKVEDVQLVTSRLGWRRH